MPSQFGREPSRAVEDDVLPRASDRCGERTVSVGHGLGGDYACAWGGLQACHDDDTGQRRIVDRVEHVSPQSDCEGRRIDASQRAGGVDFGRFLPSEVRRAITFWQRHHPQRSLGESHLRPLYQRGRSTPLRG